MSTTEEKPISNVEIAHAMKRYGGSFVYAIGKAILSADPTNLQKIRNTWPEEWQEYRQFVIRERERDES